MANLKENFPAEDNSLHHFI